ncbi:hypothetical protein LTR86_000883 [Recurvomyces mirabilis]|nr:hypothetical protein LTR86_000883 [Recurvomyces mirabilis]
MPSNKPRLYVALYVRSGSPKMPGLEDTYHWALIVGPKTETEISEGVRFHAHDRMTVVEDEAQHIWRHEEMSVSMSPVLMILIRVMVAKVADMDRLVAVLRSTSVGGEEVGWNGISWVRAVLNRLEVDGGCLGKSGVEWDVIRNAAMWYVGKKKAEHRFDGQASFDGTRVPTYDLLQGKEVVA